MNLFSTTRTISLLMIAITGINASQAQTIGSFTSVAPGGQPSTLMIPSTHTFQRLIKTGDALSLGGNLGTNLDFTGYVPIAGSSTNGRLSISTENEPAEIAVLDVSFNVATARWVVGTSGKVNFPTNDMGIVTRFCSGAVTPNNTIIVGEESTTSGNINSTFDSYEDRGWLIEIDPATRTVINQVESLRESHLPRTTGTCLFLFSILQQRVPKQMQQGPQ